MIFSSALFAALGALLVILALWVARVLVQWWPRG